MKDGEIEGRYKILKMNANNLTFRQLQTQVKAAGGKATGTRFELIKKLEYLGETEIHYDENPLTSYNREDVIELYKNTCQYCGNFIEPGKEQLDHIIPKAKGGKDEVRNITLSCARCNIKKSDNLIPEAYIGILLSAARENEDKLKNIIKQRAESNIEMKLVPNDPIIFNTNLNKTMKTILDMLTEIDNKVEKLINKEKL